jgi:hypothetical protein
MRVRDGDSALNEGGELDENIVCLSPLPPVSLGRALLSDTKTDGEDFAEPGLGDFHVGSVFRLCLQET